MTEVTRALSIVGTIMTALNSGWVCLILWILLWRYRKSLGHRRFILELAVYFTLQCLASASVTLDLSRDAFAMLTSVFRVCTGVAGFAFVVDFSLRIADVIQTLKDTEIANGRREEKANDRVMAVDNVISIVQHGLASQDRHIATLARHRAGG